MKIETIAVHGGYSPVNWHWHIDDLMADLDQALALV